MARKRRRRRPRTLDEEPYIEEIPIVGRTWYDRGWRYWLLRIRHALVMLLTSAIVLWVVIEILIVLWGDSPLFMALAVLLSLPGNIYYLILPWLVRTGKVKEAPAGVTLRRFEWFIGIVGVLFVIGLFVPLALTLFGLTFIIILMQMVGLVLRLLALSLAWELPDEKQLREEKEWYDRVLAKHREDMSRKRGGEGIEGG